MPNRILKESICYSENIERLTVFQEVFFYRLIVNCDDYGRMDARPKVLASKLFPLRDIRLNQISDALRALTSAELVVLYEEDGRPFLQMKTWDRHQSIRAKKSKYPAPESNCMQLNADEIICKHMNADACKCSRNPIQSESNPNPNPNTNPNPNPNTNPTRAREGGMFDSFWEAYPRHEAKQDARKAFDKLNPDDDLLQKMLKAIETWKKSDQWTENGGQFIPYPATWLNGKRWEDDPPAARKSKPAKTVVAQQYDQRSYGEKDEEVMQRLLQSFREE
jgi:hypothetical protein